MSESSHFVNVHDNYVTYKLNHHQHIPEIVQTLQTFNPEMTEIQFSTSLLPVNRGIMATVYCKLKKDVTVADVASAFTKAYSDKPFVRVQDSLPELHNVIGSNFTDIGFAYNEKPCSDSYSVLIICLKEQLDRQCKISTSCRDGMRRKFAYDTVILVDESIELGEKYESHRWNNC